MTNPVTRIEAEENLEQPYDTSDPEAVNKQRKKASRTHADRLHFVQAAMGTVQGRAWFYDMLNRTRVLGQTFFEDPYKTAFRCGEQNIGKQILSDIQESSPDQYLVMLRENK